MSVSRISRKMDRNWERKSFIYGREKWTSSVKAKTSKPWKKDSTSLAYVLKAILQAQPIEFVASQKSGQILMHPGR